MAPPAPSVAWAQSAIESSLIHANQLFKVFIPICRIMVYKDNSLSNVNMNSPYDPILWVHIGETRLINTSLDFINQPLKTEP